MRRQSTRPAAEQEQMSEMKIETHRLQAGEGIPNNRFPLVVYRGALSGASLSPEGCATLFRQNGWQGTWLNGVFSYWHYHLRSHEVLGCVAGSARVGFGGDHGIATDFNTGDVIVIPAGVGHKRLSRQPGFLVVGGYPPGQNGAIVGAGDIDLETAIGETMAVPLPASDPVLGTNGGLAEIWR
jgi:uncharacterized protein YjlB